MNQATAVKHNLVGVYGTLRTDQWNHQLLRTATSKGVTEVDGYDMYVMSRDSFNSVPFVVKSDKPGAKITVELFTLPEDGYEEQLRALDCLEGSPEWYTRTEVSIDGRDTWLYIFGPKVAQQYLDGGCMPVLTGDWMNPREEG